jgi:hypothetical protein
MSEDTKSARGISRREFALRAALGTATAACLPSGLLAEIPPPAVPPQNAKLSPAGEAEAEAKIQAILHKYGDHLSDEQKTDIRRLVTEAQAPFEKMRAFALDNSDQPGNVLRIYPDAAPNGSAPSR